MKPNKAKNLLNTVLNQLREHGYYLYHDGKKLSNNLILGFELDDVYIVTEEEYKEAYDILCNTNNAYVVTPEMMDDYLKARYGKWKLRQYPRMMEWHPITLAVSPTMSASATSTIKKNDG